MKKILLLIPLAICFIPSAHAIITEVYNLRISETTKRAAFEHDYEAPWLMTGTQANTFRKKYNGIKHGAVAGLGTVSYTLPHFYWRFDIAGGQVRSNDHGVHFARNQLDDFLFSMGFSKAIGNTIKLTATGLLGIPLHPDTSLLHIQFGYGHVGLGVQGDGSFIISSNRRHSVRSAARYIRFLKRTVCALNDDDEISSFRYTFGNLIDLLIAYHYNTPHYRLEVGYDQTFLCGAHITPFLASAIEQTNYIRSDFYTSYKRRFMVREYHNAITIAVSAGFDAKPKIYGNKYLATFWAAWEFNY
jgi:hypothetical protein